MQINVFGDGDFLKIWKGLHYCMWMTDKPLIQEELADRMSEFVHCFKDFDTAFSFIHAFFATEAREWSLIDRLRMDKFMMLIRRVLRQCFVLLQCRGWQSSDISRLTAVLHVTVLDGLNDHIPDGIRFHVDDIFLEELDQTACDGHLNPQGVVQLLTAFCHLIAKSTNKVLVNHTVNRVFDPLLSRISIDAESPAVSRIQVDCVKLCDQLTRLATKRGCKNRASIYRLISRIRELAEGKVSVAVREVAASSPVSIDMNPVVKLAVQHEVESLVTNDSPPRHKRKREVVQMNGSIEDNIADGKEINNSGLENCEEYIRRKKRKNLADLEHSVGILPASREKHDTIVANGHTDDTVGSDYKSAVEEEVEIWIPNKKYKGPLKNVYAKLAEDSGRKMKRNSSTTDDSSPFMTFLPVDKTPRALVKRLTNKLSHSEPKQLHKSSKQLSAVTPRSAGRQKKVKFAMDLNKSQDFEDSLNVTPQTPYNPSLQPDRTILKPSPDTNNLIALMPSKQKSPRKRLKAADFF